MFIWDYERLLTLELVWIHVCFNTIFVIANSLGTCQVSKLIYQTLWVIVCDFVLGQCKFGMNKLSTFSFIH
jgi:hypothetical protein